MSSIQAKVRSRSQADDAVAAERCAARQECVVTLSYRNQALVNHIRQARSIASLIDLEEELRGVVVSNEARSVGKIFSAWLYVLQWNEELSIFTAQEHRERERLVNQEGFTRKGQAQVHALLLSECTARETLVRSYPPPSLAKEAHAVDQLRFLESERAVRDWAVCEELLMREELQDRWRISAGGSYNQAMLLRLLDTERREMMHVLLPQWLHLCTAVRALSCSEMLQRADLEQVEMEERRSLVDYGAIKWQSALLWNRINAPAPEQSVSATLLESTHAYYEAELCALRNREGEWREEVVRCESETRFELAVCAAREWKVQYSADMAHLSRRQALEAVEERERKDISDEFHATYTSLSRAAQRSVAWLRSQQVAREQLFHSYIDGFIALGRMENASRSAVMGEFVHVKHAILSVSKVHLLQLEESKGRKEIIHMYVTETLDTHIMWVLRRAEKEAIDLGQQIVAEEDEMWVAMMKVHGAFTERHALECLLHAERVERNKMVRTAQQDFICLVEEEASLSIECTCAAPLQRREREYRDNEIQRELESFQGMCLIALSEKESLVRSCAIARAERVERHAICCTTLVAVEAQARAEMSRSATSALCTLAMRATVREEQDLRRALVAVEADEHGVLASSFASESPAARLAHSITADELRARLDIISDATVEMNALARVSLLFFPVVPHVDYTDDAMRLEANRQRAVPSVSDTLAAQRRSVADVIEPKWRRRQEQAAALERKILELLHDEVVDRAEIVHAEAQQLGFDAAILEKFAAICRSASCALLDASMQGPLASRLERHETWRDCSRDMAALERGATAGTGDVDDDERTRASLFEFLSRSSANYVSHVAAVRAKVMQLVGPLLERVFVTNMSIAIEEALQREQLVRQGWREGGTSRGPAASDPSRPEGVRSVRRSALRHIIISIKDDGQSILPERFVLQWHPHESGSRLLEPQFTPLLASQRVTVGKTVLWCLVPLHSISWDCDDLPLESEGSARSLSAPQVFTVNRDTSELDGPSAMHAIVSVQYCGVPSQLDTQSAIAAGDSAAATEFVVVQTDTAYARFFFASAEFD